MALADADTITLDPPEVAVNRARLALSGALTFGLIDVMEADYGNAEVEQFLSARRYGEIPVGHRLPNRTVEYGLRFQAVSGAGVGVGIRAVQRKVATFQAEGGWLGRTLAPRTAGEWGTDVLYADVVDASLSLPSDWMAQRQEVYLDARLTLTVLPDFYGAEVAAGSANSSSPHDSISLLGTIGGDYPARSRYTITDTGSTARKLVVVGAQARTYGTASTEALAYEAEALTVLDQAAAGAISGAHGGTAVSNAKIADSWTPILSTQIAASGHLTHNGNYRVLARCSANADAEVRIEYSVGDSLVRTVNDPASLPGSGTTVFYLRDLGEVRLPKAPVGTQRWEGRILGRSDTVNSTVAIDKIYLVPIESISIANQRRDPSYFYTPDSYIGRESFGDSAGTVEASSLDVGGTWAKTGTGASWRYDGAGVAYGGTAGPAAYYRTSAASASDTYVEAKFSISQIPTLDGDVEVGLLARYSGTTNYAGIYFNPNPDGLDTPAADGSDAEVGIRVGSSGTGETFPITAGREYRLAAAITANGVFRIWAWEDGDHYPNSPLVSGYFPSLATGGSAASGSVGFYSSGDFNNGLALGSATIDDWFAYTPSADGAVLSGKSLSLRHDGGWRETATAGIYAPALVTGGYPRDPVAGIESRVTRTLIVPSTGDLDDEPDLSPAAFTVTRHYSPTYLFVPET